MDFLMCQSLSGMFRGKRADAVVFLPFVFIRRLVEEMKDLNHLEEALSEIRRGREDDHC